MRHTSQVIPQSSASRDWSSYNRAQVGREPRKLVERAISLTGPANGRHALDLGSGIGVEAQYLAQNGWRVSTLDPDPTVADHLIRLASHYPIHHMSLRLEDLSQLPPSGLIHSSAALPYVPREQFPRVWNMIRSALEPQGILAIDLFGTDDDWAHIEGTFFSRADVLNLLEGLAIVQLSEEKYDGRAFSGPKHWHTFQILARPP